MMGSICSLIFKNKDDNKPSEEESGDKIKPPPEPSDSKNIVPVHPQKEVVAFTAKLNVADSTPYHRGALKLEEVVLNEGRGYSPETGLFVCPLRGLYFFTVHMSVLGRAHCELYKNGQSLATLYDTSHPHHCPQVATISSVVPLEEKDQVWVNLWGHGRHELIATEDSDTVFLGFLLG